MCVINDAPAATAIGNVSSQGALLIIQLKTLCCRLNIALYLHSFRRELRIHSLDLSISYTGVDVD